MQIALKPSGLCLQPQGLIKKYLPTKSVSPYSDAKSLTKTDFACLMNSFFG